MKILVKISAICALFLLTISANAQMKFGVKAGLNLANTSVKSGGNDVSLDGLTAFHLGAIGELSLGESLAFQPGVLFSIKGYSTEMLGVDVKAKVNYIEVPLNLLYKFDAGSLKIFGQAGPYLGYAISGKYKADDEDTDMNIGSDEENDDLKALDFGLNVGAGVEVSNFQISLNYGLGLANLMPGGDSDNSMKNNVFGISVAYLFGK